jgi:hypothetical protein
MKRLLLLSALTLGLVAAMAQPIRELNRLPADSLPPGSEVYAFSNARGVLLLFQEGAEAEIFHLDERLQLIDRFQLTDLPPSDQVDQLGFTYREGQLNIIYRDKGSDEVQVLQVLPETGSTQMFRMNMADLFRGSTQWANFTYQGALHMIRLPRSGDQIRLCRFEGGRDFHTEIFDLQRLSLDREVQDLMVRIDSSNRHQLDQTYSPAKLYLQGNQLYLTHDQAGGTTVAQIDLDSNQKEEYHLPTPTEQGRSNSLLADLNLYQLAATSDSLYFRIYDLTSLRPLTTFAYTNADPLELRTGPVVIRHPAGQSQDEWPLAEVLARWSEAPHLALAMQPVGRDLVRLSLGAVWPMRNHGLTGIVIDEKSQSVSFPSLIDLRTLVPTADQLPALVAKDFPPDRLRQGAMPITFAINGRRYWGYFDPASGEYVVGE